MIGIIARLPFAFFAELTSRVSQQVADWQVAFLIEIILLFSYSAVSILLVQGTRKVPVTVCKTYCRKQTIWWSTSVYPLKINAAGLCLWIIFARRQLCCYHFFL